MSGGIESAIRSKASQLLADGSVDCVIGYERSRRGQVRPTFVYSADQVERLVWNDECHHNLVVFLHDRKAMTSRSGEVRKTALVVKPCDSRALNVLLHEGQIKRDQVYVIGIACSGVCSEPSGDSSSESSVLASRCRRCIDRVPVVYDTLLGDAPAVESVEDDWSDVAHLEEMSVEERLAFWTREFDACIRCYACRQACPGCYCFECMAEQVDPLWSGISIELPEKAFFHVMRAYHLAGRCVECDACEQACPVNIPIGLLNRKFVKEVKELFDYHAGSDPETPPPLATFLRDEDLPL
jgi:formate dehydrogenase subunit beta